MGVGGSNGSAGAAVEVVQPDGQTLDSVNLTSGGQVDLDLPAIESGGTYGVRVDASTTSQAGTGTYSVTVSTPLTGELELDGASLVKTVGKLGQDVRLTFEGSAGQLVNLGLQGVKSAMVYLLQPDGTTLNTLSLVTNGKQDIDPSALPESGTYTVRIDPGSNGMGPYTSTLSTPATSTVELVVNGGASPVVVTRAGQDGRLPFSATAGQQLTLTTVTPSGKAADVFVYAPDGTTLRSGYASGTSKLGLPALTASGAYTARVDPTSNATGTYTLTLTTAGMGRAPGRRQLGSTGGGAGAAKGKGLAKVELPRPAEQQAGPTWEQLVAALEAEGAVPGNRAEVTKHYLFGGQRVAVRQAGNEVFYLFGDQLGSASLVVDWQGWKVSEVRYTPWGEVRWGWELDGSGYTDRLFTGQLAQNGEYVGRLYDYGARFYSPWLGRFVSADTRVPDGAEPREPEPLRLCRQQPAEVHGPGWPVLADLHCHRRSAHRRGGRRGAGGRATDDRQRGEWPTVAGGHRSLRGGQGRAWSAPCRRGRRRDAGGATLVTAVGAGAFSGVVAGQVEQATSNILEGKSVTEGLFNPADMIRDGAMSSILAGWGTSSARL